MATAATSELINSLYTRVPNLVEQAGHSEIYGIDVSALSDPVKLILAKYLTAYNCNVEEAAQAIEATLKWRKDFKPRSAAFEEHHSSKFDGLGYVTKLGDDIVTWNIYGAAAKDPKALFEPLDEFLRWRVGLQERAVELLNIKEYVGDGTKDTKQAIQVHDYLQVSFFRMDPTAKAGSKATIDIMTKHYPETMRRKFFLNVPVVMGWMFSAMRMVLSRATTDKFTVLSYGSYLALTENLGHRESLPKEYGGTKEEGSLSLLAEKWEVGKEKQQMSANV